MFRMFMKPRVFPLGRWKQTSIRNIDRKHKIIRFNSINGTDDHSLTGGRSVSARPSKPK